MLQHAQRCCEEDHEDEEEEEDKEQGENGDGEEVNGAPHVLEESTTAAGNCLKWGDLQVLVESSMCGTASTERKRS